MKVVVKVIEAEGAPDELATLVQAATTTDVVPLGAVSDAETIPASAVLDATDATHATNATPSRDETFEPAFGVTAAGEAMPQFAFDDWREIPVDYRWWNDPGTTCHVRTRPGIDVAMCRLSPKKIGTRRMSYENPPAESIAEVCGTCKRRIEEARRDA